jgi:hypothetical protein
MPVAYPTTTVTTTFNGKHIPDGDHTVTRLQMAWSEWAMLAMCLLKL